MKKQITTQIIKKTKDDYNRIASQFDSTRKYNWQEIANIIERLNIKEGVKVLDLGCGGGRLYELLEKYKVDYTGVDLSDQLIDIAQKKYPKVKFEVGDITGFKSEKKYDYVFSIAVLHHIPSKNLRKKSVENIKKALKPGGTAVVSVWYFWNQKKYIKKILGDFFSIQNLKFKIQNYSLSFGDLYIPWKNQKGEILAQRYHHAWTARELKRQGFKIISRKRNLIGIYQ